MVIIFLRCREGHKSSFKINKNGRIIYWDYSDLQDEVVTSYKKTDYTYDSHGNVIKMVWDGISYKSKVTDHGVLTATYNLTKPDIIMKGGPMKFLAGMRWTMLPMANNNQITSFTYSQTITMPEHKIVVGHDDKTNADIYKTIPEKKVNPNVSKTFSYTYNSNNEVTGFTVTGSGKPLNFKVGYSSVKCK